MNFELFSGQLLLLIYCIASSCACLCLCHCDGEWINSSATNNGIRFNFFLLLLARQRHWHLHFSSMTLSGPDDQYERTNVNSKCQKNSDCVCNICSYRQKQSAIWQSLTTLKLLHSHGWRQSSVKKTDLPRDEFLFSFLEQLLLKLISVKIFSTLAMT